MQYAGKAEGDGALNGILAQDVGITLAVPGGALFPLGRLVRPLINSRGEPRLHKAERVDHCLEVKAGTFLLVHRLELAGLGGARHIQVVHEITGAAGNRVLAPFRAGRIWILRLRRQRVYDSQKTGYTGDPRRETVLRDFSDPDIRGNSPYLFFSLTRPRMNCMFCQKPGFPGPTDILSLLKIAGFSMDIGSGRRLLRLIQFSKLRWCYPQ